MKLHNIIHIWNIDETSIPPGRRLFVRFLKRIIIVVEGFTKNNLMSHASALTYSSLLAAIPILAIVFAVGRGFGFDSLIEERIRESLLENPEIADTVFSFVESYLQHTKGGVFIGAGLILLLYTLVNLTTNIETAFNTIWKVSMSRNYYRKIVDYVSVFFLLPFVIVIVSGIRIFLMTFQSLLPEYQYVSDTMNFIVKGTPLVLTCFAFVVLYKLMPNTKVKWRYAILPGILAGLAFLILQYFYFHYQIKLSSYNAIYGSFAAIPLFMLWLQLSWCICLIGVQMCYSEQCTDDYAFERSSGELSRRYSDSLRLLLMSRICKRFQEGSSPFTSHTLSADTQLPQTLVRMMLEELVDMQLLVETHNEKGTKTQYLPAFDIHRMTVREVMQHIDRFGADQLTRSWQNKTKEWEKISRVRSGKEDCILTEI